MNIIDQITGQKMKQRLKKYCLRIIGDSEAFTVEARFLHSVCMIILVGLVSSMLYGHIVGRPVLALPIFSVFTLVYLLYYLSRFQGKHYLCLVLFQLLNIALLFIDYHFNSGSNGTNYAISILIFLISLATVSVWQYWIWVPLNVIAILGILCYEDVYPNRLPDSYTNPTLRLIHFVHIYIAIAVIIMLFTNYIRKTLSRENDEASRKITALEQLNQTKDKLLSILAHDLKEPLTSIQGFLELLTEYNLEEPERMNIQKQLLNRTKDTSYLLANVLAWTKGQMEVAEVKLTNLQLSETFGQTLKLVEGLAEEKGIEFTYKLSDQICVFGDEDMLQLVIRNIVINAIKFTNPGGKIWFDVQIKEKNCLLSITDNGVGIPLIRQPGIFAFSARSTFGTSKEKGAGLGLVLCKEFMELQGGQIGFTSKENEGSTFYLIMPLCRTHQKDNGVPRDV